ncbi:MAG TPA: serine O-acetyltransferase EpsC [Candidatus Binataceae bacterium]|jgi:serine O-acetyltransferase|nr:serine O-acetyltransferase EpsC [Candidatus Binataceae bacterium]
MSVHGRINNGAGNARLHWDLDRIVTELRLSRDRSGQTCDSGICEMPSREALRTIVDGLFATLFPTQLGLPDLTDEGIDYFVGHTLDATLRSLHLQVQRELRFASQQTESDRAEGDGRAIEITRDFAARLPHVHTLLESDIQAAYQGDPAARSIQEVRLCYPGITAMTHHRLAHELYLLGAPLLARIIAELAHSATGIDIHPGAEIGDSFFIDHGTGVVIGETAIVGRRVRVYQAVTLGAKSFPVGRNGELVKGVPRHPVVEDDVVIYAGATILGRITIGRGSMIGGNVWLTRSVPAGSNVTQMQARSEVFDSGGGI